MLSDFFFINFYNSSHLYLFPALLGFFLSADKVEVFIEVLTTMEIFSHRDTQCGN